MAVFCFFLLYPVCLSSLCFSDIFPSLFYTQLHLHLLFPAFFFFQFFPFGGQPKATRCEWNVTEWEGLHSGSENRERERERKHLRKRVFERSFLPPILDVF